MSDPKPDFTLNLTPELRRTIVEFLADTAIYAFAQGAQAQECPCEDEPTVPVMSIPAPRSFTFNGTPESLAKGFEPEGEMTELEREVQALMEPDKHGNHTRPARAAFLGDSFARPIQRTLDALWKFAEQTRERLSEAREGWKLAEVRVNALIHNIASMRGELSVMDERIENARMEGYRAAMNDKLNGGLHDILNEERAHERKRLWDVLNTNAQVYLLVTGDKVTAFDRVDVANVLGVKP